MKHPKIFYSKWFPFYFRGIMIPFIGIVIKEEYKTSTRLMNHEMIHWYQFKRMGVILFITRYVFQLIFIGYDTMPMEMEARQNEEEHIKWNYRKNYFNKTYK